VELTVVSFLPSVRLSVTRWYCIKTNELRIMWFSPTGSVGLVFETNFRTLGRRYC